MSRSDVLGAAVAVLRAGRGRGDRAAAALIDKLDPSADEPSPGELAVAGGAFGLSAGQLQALALTAAVELDPRIGLVLARLQGLADALRPTVATLAELCGLDVIDDLGPDGTLRRHRLIELSGDLALPLPFVAARCPAAVWGRLAGVPASRRAAVIEAAALALPDAVRASIEAHAAWLATAGRRGLIVVWGPGGAGRHAIAEAVCAAAGLRARRVDAGVLVDREVCAAFERDARWGGEALVLASETPAPLPAAASWLARAEVPRIWIQSGAPDWLVETPGPTRSFEVGELAAEHRAEIWRRALREPALDTGALARRYRFGPGRIERVAELVRADGTAVSAAAIAAATRATSRPGISALAQRLPPRPEDELIVTAAVRRELSLASGWARSHTLLYDTWGMTSGTSKARGVTCLFAGPPGTGKTLAAQVIAGNVDRDLFRVDLSQAVSKWLGETEKNLARLFDEAQDAGAILFFDEADALFATRTQVRDANDRYANLETGYLLQRLEVHDGIVVLASNRRQDLDTAFLRRFDVIVEFAAPGPAERLRLWQRHLPAPPRAADDVDAGALSTLFELSGGQIRNAVLAAIAMTAERTDAGDRLTMPYLVRAGTRELLRAGRLVNPAEFGAWAAEVRTALPSGAT